MCDAFVLEKALKHNRLAVNLVAGSAAASLTATTTGRLGIRIIEKDKPDGLNGVKDRGRMRGGLWLNKQKAHDVNRFRAVSLGIVRLKADLALSVHHTTR